MGCDIHPVAQVLDDEGKWVEVEAPRGEYGSALTPRCYPLFAALTGVVRNDYDIEGIAELRGIPDDFDSERDMGDHSFGWLFYSEILAYHWYQPAPRQYSEWAATLHELCAGWLSALATTFEGRDPARCRLVFGFDS